MVFIQWCFLSSKMRLSEQWCFVFPQKIVWTLFSNSISSVVFCGVFSEWCFLRHSTSCVLEECIHLSNGAIRGRSEGCCSLLLALFFQKRELKNREIMRLWTSCINQPPLLHLYPIIAWPHDYWSPHLLSWTPKTERRNYTEYGTRGAPACASRYLLADQAYEDASHSPPQAFQPKLKDNRFLPDKQ